MATHDWSLDIYCRFDVGFKKIASLITREKEKKNLELKFENHDFVDCVSKVITDSEYIFINISCLKIYKGLVT